MVRAGGAEAFAALRHFVTEELPRCDEPIIERETRSRKLPRGLNSLHISGAWDLSPVSGGTAQGAVVLLAGISITAEFAASEGPSVEHDRLRRGFTGVRGHIEKLLVSHPGGAEAGILKAHLAMLDDVSLLRETARRIDSGHSAAQSVMEASEHFGALLRERAVDLREICTELLEEMYGPEFKPATVELRGPSILVAEALAPHQLLTLDRHWLEGIVVEVAGATSHRHDSGAVDG